MSVPHGATYPAGPTFEASVNSGKRKGFWGKTKDHFTHGIEKSADGINDLLSASLIFVVAAIIGGGAVAWFGYQWHLAEVKNQAIGYQKTLQTVSFKTFTSELAKIDPEEKKDFVTNNSVCSDAFINSNPEADLKTVCLNDYFWRKRKTKSQIAQGGSQ